MKFLCLTNEKNIATNKLLEVACAKRNVEYTESVDLSSWSPIDNFLMYRVANATEAKVLEKTLLLKQNITSLRQTYFSCFLDNAVDSTLYLQNKGVLMPKTFQIIGKNHSKILNLIKSESLSFPIIIKCSVGSHGVGIIRVDSSASLLSVVDLLFAQDIQFIIREFIHVASSARLIVLENKVIDSIEYVSPSADFRSNVGNLPTVYKKKFPEDIQLLAIQAVKAMEVDFGGVDILINEKGEGYVAEVNFPCFFPRCQLLTGTDIALQLIDYLINKSRITAS